MNSGHYGNSATSQPNGVVVGHVRYLETSYGKHDEIFLFVACFCSDCGLLSPPQSIDQARSLQLPFTTLSEIDPPLIQSSIR